MFTDAAGNITAIEHKDSTETFDLIYLTNTAGNPTEYVYKNIFSIYFPLI